MWPFRKKTEEKIEENAVETPYEKLSKEAAADIASFRKLGEKFNFMGIEMIVVNNIHYPIKGRSFPALEASYRNNNGDLKDILFYRRDLIALQAENPITEKT